MALSPKEKKELQQRFEKQLLPDLDMSFELNGEVYKFNFDKNKSGDYIDSFTQAVWGGYQDAEEWKNMVNIRRQNYLNTLNQSRVRATVINVSR